MVLCRQDQQDIVAVIICGVPNADLVVEGHIGEKGVVFWKRFREK
jgi:hypothetical protein